MASLPSREEGGITSETVANNPITEDAVEFCDVYIPTCSGPLHIVLPRGVAQTTISQLRQLVLDELHRRRSQASSSGAYRTGLATTAQQHHDRRLGGTANISGISSDSSLFSPTLLPRYNVRLMYRGRELRHGEWSMLSLGVQSGSTLHALVTEVASATPHVSGSSPQQQQQQQSGQGTPTAENAPPRGISIMSVSPEYMHDAREAIATAIRTIWPNNNNNANNVSVITSGPLAAHRHDVDSATPVDRTLNSVATDSDRAREESQAHRGAIDRAQLNNNELLHLLRAERRSGRQAVVDGPHQHPLHTYDGTASVAMGLGQDNESGHRPGLSSTSAVMAASAPPLVFVSAMSDARSPGGGRSSQAGASAGGGGANVTQGGREGGAASSTPTRLIDPLELNEQTRGNTQNGFLSEAEMQAEMERQSNLMTLMLQSFCIGFILGPLVFFRPLTPTVMFGSMFGFFVNVLFYWLVLSDSITTY